MDKQQIEALRLQLLANGYSPIRNVDKRTFMTGWPTVHLDEAEIRSWTRMRDSSTGLRVENGLAVIDIDINDAALVDEIADMILDVCPQLDRADVPLMVRRGRGAKEAWFVRTEELFGRIHSRTWLPAGVTAEEGEPAAVEVFGGASSRQFGSFGWHTQPQDAADGVGVEYRWNDASPANTPLAALPVLPKQAFFAIVDGIEAVLARNGWEPVLRSAKGENAGERVYDLTDEMAFSCSDGVTRSLDDLRAYLKETGDEHLRCNAAFVEGPQAKRTDRCLVSLTRAGLVAIFETASGVTHSEAAAKPVDYGPEIDRITEKLRELDERRRLKIKNADDFQTAVSKALAMYAYCPYQQNDVVPVWAASTEDGKPLAKFRSELMPNVVEEVGPRGGLRTVNPVDTWMRHEQRLTVSGIRMRPDMPKPTYQEDGQLWVNCFIAPYHDQNIVREGQDVFLRFMAHLFPDEAERRWFMSWLSFKYRRPEVPGPGVVLVAKKQGAGRGTLFSMIRQAFGSTHIRKVDGSTLTGEGGQSQYNTWMSGTTMVLIDELFNAGTGMHLWQRKKAYDRIKGLIDPASREVEIIRKTQNNFATVTFTSFLMATNNLNALPLDEDDRRICVLTNGGPLNDDPELVAAMARYRRGAGVSEGFAAGIAEVLSSYDVAGYDPYAVPPMFAGKINMINQNRTDVGEAAEQALHELPGDFVTRTAFVDRVKLMLPPDAHKNVVQEARERIDRSDWIFLGRVKVKENGSKADVWARNKQAEITWMNASLAERPALLKPNEDPRSKLSDLQAKALEKGISVVREH